MEKNCEIGAYEMGILDRFRLDGKVALVAGAGSGIGRGYALALAEAGADVAMVDIEEERAHEVAEEVKAIGSQSVSLQADVSRNVDIAQMVGSVLKEFGKLDIGVNNAGISAGISAGKLPRSLGHTEEDWDWVYGLNLRGSFLCAKEEALSMMKQGKGKIIFTASISGIHGIIGSSVAYCATKAAVIQMTKILAYELGPSGITVNSISPGVTRTRMIEAGLKDPTRQDKVLADWKNIADRTPLGRMEMPEDLQGTLVYLASDASDYVTGINIVVDGGFTLFPIHTRDH